MSESLEREQSPHLSTRITLTRELNQLVDLVSHAGQECFVALALSVSSLSIDASQIEQQVASIAEKVQLESAQLEKNCFTILTLQQPLLKDLRLVIGVLRMSPQFTRVAVYALRLVALSNLIQDKNLVPAELITISENCQLMLKDVLYAFKSGSAALAYELVNKDHEIDFLHDTSFKKIIQRIASDRKDLIEVDAQLLTIVRLLERIGDTVANISKEVYFIHSGKRIQSG
ncbi:MAG: PhoU domain-containing protein [Candidatus Caenarcaniphilales bacterium]|nr:PhoU domain-containing protein [Candidatus Caenarcaniphilales bacterium]